LVLQNLANSLYRCARDSAAAVNSRDAFRRKRQETSISDGGFRDNNSKLPFRTTSQVLWSLQPRTSFSKTRDLCGSRRNLLFCPNYEGIIKIDRSRGTNLQIVENGRRMPGLVIAEYFHLTSTLITFVTDSRSRIPQWQHSGFAKLQAVPKNGKPVCSWANRDEALMDVADKIKKMVDEKVGNQ
jgi:hypothetical protein